MNQVHRKVTEWCVEVTNTVRKYVEADSQKEAEETAMEDSWHSGVVQQQINHIEKLSK